MGGWWYNSPFFLKQNIMQIISKAPEKTKVDFTKPDISRVKKQLQFENDFTEDDAFIEDCLKDAISQVEQDTNSDVAETDNVLTFKTTSGVQKFTKIYQAPFISITKVEAFNNGEWTDVAATKYDVDSDFMSFTIEALEAIQAEKLRVTFKTGFTDDKRPRELVHAAVILAADYYTNDRSQYIEGSTKESALYSRKIKNHKRNYF